MAGGAAGPTAAPLGSASAQPDRAAATPMIKAAGVVARVRGVTAYGSRLQFE
jgi:hypothetical protein